MWQIGGTFESSGLALTVPVGTGLIDVYPNALVAFSFRRLRDSYSGSAIRLRRESDNAEADIGFDGSGDFDTAAATTHLAGSNGFITTWYDQSGNGYNALQVTAGSQPRYLSNGLNSMSSCRLDATGSMHFVRTNLATAGSNVLSAFAVARPGGTNTGGLVSLAEMSQTNDWDNDYSMVPLVSDGDNSGFNANLSGTACGTVEFAGGGVAFRGASFKLAAGTFYVAQDGAAGSTASDTLDLGGPTNDLCRLTLGARYQSGSVNTYWDGGDMSEIIVYLADRSADLAAIDANQAAYWGF